MTHASRILTAVLCITLSMLLVGPSLSWGQPPVRVTLDFNEIDLPVFVRFISELTGKNFVLDEKVKGKISLFSPTKVTVEQAYNMFLSALEMRRLMAIPKGNVIQIVPVAEFPPERGVYVYRLKHANTTDTATVLTNVVAKSQVTQPNVPGGVQPIRVPNEFEGPVQIFADKPTNSLIITATSRDYDRLQSVIKALDTRRKQVFVEAVIMEVTVERLRQLGSEPVQAVGAFKAGAIRGLGSLNRLPEDIASIAQTLSGQVAGGPVSILNTLNIRAFLQLLMTFNDTNVLSTPQLLAADNQKAKIVVGENRPFPTGQSQGITGGTLVTIERKDVGVSLEITPQVLDNGLIRLEVKQEITAITPDPQTIGSGNASVPVGPTTTKRAMETTTIAKDRQTVVIGGLVRDNIILNERKVPLLGDIPGLGWLFKFQQKNVEKLNLLVFLSPHLISDENDMIDLNLRKTGEVELLQQENRIEEPTGVDRATERLLPEEQPLAPANSGRH